MKYVTSDLHFYHKNVMNFCKETRPFDSMDQMHESIIYEINNLPNCEMLYHLGDFCFGGPNKTRAILERIKQPMTMILGNHDQSNRKVYGEHFPTFDYKEIKHNGLKIVMFHYPMHEWNNGHHGSVHLYGHVHGRFQAPGRCIDAGWDAHGRILSLDEAVEMATQREIFQPCHTAREEQSR